MFFAAGFQISDNLYLSAQPLRPRSFPGHSHYETCGDYMSINDEVVDQGFFFWHWLPVLLSRQEIVVRGAPYPMDVGVSYRNKPFVYVDLAPQMWFLFQPCRLVCINIPNFLSAFATVTFGFSPRVVVVWALRFFLGLTLVMIRTTHAVRRAFWLSSCVNQSVTVTGNLQKVVIFYVPFLFH